MSIQFLLGMIETHLIDKISTITTWNEKPTSQNIKPYITKCNQPIFSQKTKKKRFIRKGRHTLIMHRKKRTAYGAEKIDENKPFEAEFGDECLAPKRSLANEDEPT